MSYSWSLLRSQCKQLLPDRLVVSCRLAGNVLRLMQVWPQRVCMVSALPLDSLASRFVQELPFQTSWNTTHVANVYMSSDVPASAATLQ